MDPPLSKHDILVGLFVVLGIAALAVLAIIVIGPDLLDWGSVEVRTYLSKTYGLKRGVPVTYLDMEVGHVRSVELSDRENETERVEVRFTVNKRFKDRITTGFHTTLEKQQFGGIISGKIILNPPRAPVERARSVQNGDELKYLESSTPLEELTDFPGVFKQRVLPEIEKLLDGLNDFLDQVNRPEGDFRVSLSVLRETAERLARSDGEFMTTLGLARDLMEELNDEENLLMVLLHNRELARNLDETLVNLKDASEKGMVLLDDGKDAVRHAKEAARTAREILEEARPRAAEMLARVLEIEERTAALLQEAEYISANLAEASANLPGLVRDVEDQIRQVDLITRAMKKIWFIRWNLEEELIQDPTLLRPLLLHDFKRGERPDKKTGRSEEQ